MAVVERCIFLLAFVMLENRTIFINFSVLKHRVLESVFRLTVLLHKVENNTKGPLHTVPEELFTGRKFVH